MASLTKVIEITSITFFPNWTKRLCRPRKDLAEIFGCVPKPDKLRPQKLFHPRTGYLVESQGGHGFIRIFRLSYDIPEERINHIEEIVGDSISAHEVKRLLTSLRERGLIDSRERLLIEVAMRHAEELGSSEFDISPYKRSIIQAELLKRMLRSLALS